MANVFTCPVDVMETNNSAALGAALRAMQTVEQKTWTEVVTAFTDVLSNSRVNPDVNTSSIYEQLRKTYAKREATQLEN
jgi:sugar (pentulose or hexulose) kinase